MKIDIKRTSATPKSARAMQLQGMFDCPVEDKTTVKWSGDFPIEEQPWNVGLIVGPSGSGKSTVLTEAFGSTSPLDWGSSSVVDSFAEHLSIRDIADACAAVGFNTIPAWLRPFSVLSNGEQFRVEMARRLLETDKRIVVDEFTSVVDRQVAQIGASAIQKYVRREQKQFVAASCHYDIVDWLQPDWLFEPATMRFQRRSVQRRPDIDVVVGRVPYSAWRLFAPFHYMSVSLNKSARCFGLWANGPASSVRRSANKAACAGEKYTRHLANSYAA